MKSFILFGSTIVLVGCCVLGYGIWSQEQQDISYKDSVQAAKTAETLRNALIQFNQAKTRGDYDKLESSLTKAQREALGPQVRLKKAVVAFSEAEDFLDRARALQNSLSEPGKKIHPLAQEMFEKSLPFYVEAKNEVDRLSEVKGDADYNFRLNYVKGEVYFRYIQVLSTDETAKELFNQTVGFYKRALRYRPADTNTVINVELLIQKQQQMSGGRDQTPQRNTLLNQRPGAGRSKGN